MNISSFRNSVKISHPEDGKQRMEKRIRLFQPFNSKNPAKQKVIFYKNKVSCFKLDSNNKEHFDAVTSELKFWADL